jgi:hypothetical protein
MSNEKNKCSLCGKEKCSSCGKDSTAALIVIAGRKSKKPEEPPLCTNCFLKTEKRDGAMI